jgi:pimeloyl-ACP methyl ester carboxylesterase
MTVAQHVADLDAVIDEETLVVGWSWGAMLALSYSVAHPDRVRGIALVGCGTYDAQSREQYQRAMHERQTADQRDEVDRLQRAMEAARGAERDALFARLGTVAARIHSVDLLSEEEAEVPADAQGYEETWGDVMRLQREGIEPGSFTAIGAPIILMQGDRDPHPGPLIYSPLHEHMPQLAFYEIPSCGHAPWVERAGRGPFLDRLTSWLRGAAGRNFLGAPPRSE